MRSPEPNGSSRAPQGGLTQGGDYHSPYYSHLSGAQVPQSYYAPAMPPHDAYGQHGANQYYHPPPPVSHPYPATSASKSRRSRPPMTPVGHHDAPVVINVQKSTVTTPLSIRNAIQTIITISWDTALTLCRQDTTQATVQ